MLLDNAIVGSFAVFGALHALYYLGDAVKNFIYIIRAAKE